MTIDPLYYILIAVLVPLVLALGINAGSDEHRVDLGLDSGPDDGPDDDTDNHPTFLIPNASGAHHAQRRRYRIDRIDRIGPDDRRRSTHPSY